MSLEQAIQNWRSRLGVGSKWTVKLFESEYLAQITDVYYNKDLGSIMVDFDIMNHFWELTYRVPVQEFMSKYGVENLGVEEWTNYLTN